MHQRPASQVPSRSLKDPAAFPRRINKHLAVLGIETRRGADELIKAGIVLINGKVAQAGDWVQETDTVEVKQKTPKRYAYYAYNKPVGVVTHSAQEGEVDIKQRTAFAGMPKDVFPLGRLDKASSGLIILTNDGRITDRLLNPDYEHEKEYIVSTTKKIGPSFQRILEKGVDIEGYVTRPSKIKLRGDQEFSIVLQEGKKHQIRRMVVALRNDVVNLKRVRVMNIRLGNQKAGTTRAIEGEELDTFLKQLGL